MDNIARLSRECFFETMIKCNFIPKSVIYYTCCSLYVHKNVYSLFLFLTVTLFFQVKIKIIIIENSYIYFFFFCNCEEKETNIPILKRRKIGINYLS